MDVLRFYRQEIRHEFDLLSTRVSSYIMSQSFLVTAFAISMGNTTPWAKSFALICPGVLVAIGILLSIRAIPGISGACQTIDLWREKQQNLLDSCAELKELLLIRKTISDETGNRRDLIHERSLVFATWAPWVFGIGWLIFSVLWGYVGLTYRLWKV
ncbi:MAG TPA: hypothetical protein VF590_22225 [Isosphaeraceae bacterium]